MKRKGVVSVCNQIAVSAVLTLLLLLGGCNGDGGALPPSPLVSESFRSDTNKNVAIQSDALNREFLLQGNMVTLDGAPQFGNLKSRIVVFQKQGGKLFMLESQVGHTVMPDTPFALILAEFPIVREESGWIYFDFNQGMSKIFMVSDMYASDDAGTGYHPSFNATAVRSSYLSEVDISHQNRLAVRQSAQIEGGNSTLPSVEVRYYLSPYLPNTSFKPSDSPGFDYAGYFEVMPQLQNGGTTKVYAMKWNLNNKPITYYLSSETPQSYRQAVRNGVLYWNAALGEEIFAVADAPAGVTAPDMERNIIQWLNYDTAGYAYADMQADPRTGEILHAQIFMPSVFAFASRKDVWRYLKILEGSSSSSNSRVALKNLYSPRICDYSSKERMMKGVTSLLASGASDEMILKASQAYVQEVVTHEVGHTMGLRHNFAGSIAAEHAGYTRKELYDNFLQGGPYISMIPSSSIMDYHDDTEAVLAADRYTIEQKALPHDVSAMRFLYRGMALDKNIPYCSDGEADAALLDCRTFDYGNSPLEFVSSTLKQNLSVDILPVSFYLELAAKVMAGKAVADLRPSPSMRAASILKDKPMLLAAFSDTGLYVRTLKKLYPGILLKDVDTTALRQATIPVVRTDLEGWLLKNSFGVKSLTDLFQTIDPAWKDAWITRFNQISEDPAFYTIVAEDGASRTFTKNERAQLRSIAATYFNDLIPALVAEDVKLLSLTTARIDLVDGTAGDGFRAAMNASANEYLMARSGASLPVTVGGVALNLPHFRYDWNVRLDASQLMKKRAVPTALWWGMRETAANMSSLTTLLESSIVGVGGTFLSAVVANSFAAADNSAYQWYLENAQLLQNGF